MQSRVFALRWRVSQKKRDIRIFFYYFFQRVKLFRRADAVWVSADVGRGLSGPDADVGRGLSGPDADVGRGLSGVDTNAGCLFWWLL